MATLLALVVAVRLVARLLVKLALRTVDEGAQSQPQPRAHACAVPALLAPPACATVVTQHSLAVRALVAVALPAALLRGPLLLLDCAGGRFLGRSSIVREDLVEVRQCSRVSACVPVSGLAAMGLESWDDSCEEGGVVVLEEMSVLVAASLPGLHCSFEGRLGC